MIVFPDFEKVDKISENFGHLCEKNTGHKTPNFRIFFLKNAIKRGRQWA